MALTQHSSIASLLPFGATPDDLYVLLAGIAAFLSVYAVGQSLSQRDTLGPRLRALQERRRELQDGIKGSKKRKRPQDDDKPLTRVIVERLHLLQRDQKAKIMQRLIEAGWRSPNAIFTYVFFTFAMPILFIVVGFLVVKVDWSDLGGLNGLRLTIPIIAGYVGLKMPDVMLLNQRNKRWQAIRKGLPDALDLMMVCAEAGLTLSATLGRVARELGISHPELADEMGITSVEIGFLPQSKTALEHLQQRVNLPEVRGIVSVLIQTEKYGTPVAQALRVLAREYRQQRLLRAEQKAARLPAIMTIPMILFILPCLFIVVMTPAIIQIMDELSKR